MNTFVLPLYDRTSVGAVIPVAGGGGVYAGSIILNDHTGH